MALSMILVHQILTGRVDGGLNIENLVVAPLSVTGVCYIESLKGPRRKTMAGR